MFNNRGVALFISIFLVFILSIIGSAFIVKSFNQSRQSLNYNKSEQAFWNAEAGIQRGAYEINNNCQKFSQWIPNTLCTNCYECTTDTTMPITGSMYLLGTGSFNISNGTHDFRTILETRSNYSQNGNTITGSLTSIGYFRNPNNNNEVLKRKIFTNMSFRETFGYAILADWHLQIASRTSLDSYKSSTGPYGGANAHLSSTPPKIFVHSNGNTGESIYVGDLDANLIEANLTAPTGGTFTLVGTAPTNVTGTKTNISSKVIIDPFTVPQDLIDCTVAGICNDNCTGTCHPGPSPIALSDSETIHFNGDYKIAGIDGVGDVQFIVDDDTRIYMTGNFELGNNSDIIVEDGVTLTIYIDGYVFFNSAVMTGNRNTKIPSNIHIYSTKVNAIPTDGQVSSTWGLRFGNNCDFYGIIYAPNANIDTNSNIDFFGSMVGRYIEIGQLNNIHYDQDIPLNDIPKGLKITNWQEKTPQPSD